MTVDFQVRSPESQVNEDLRQEMIMIKYCTILMVVITQYAGQIQAKGGGENDLESDGIKIG